MTRYIIRRLLLFIPTLLAAVTLVFVLFRMIPGDPARLLAGQLASEEVVESLRQEMGLDQPIYIQYLDFLGTLAHGQLGYTHVFQQDASVQVFERLPYTVGLAGAAMLIAAIAGLTAGVISAIKPYSWIDYLTTITAVAGVSMPSFWFGLMLIAGVSVYLGLLPVAGAERPSAIILPALTLAVNQIAIIARMTRSTMLGVLGDDYIRTARSKGLRNSRVILRHALRNALIPTITIAGLQLGYLLGGSVVVETVFSWPGIGRLMITSIDTRDYAMVQAITVVFAFMMLSVNLLIDVLYAALDPRIRYE